MSLSKMHVYVRVYIYFFFYFKVVRKILNEIWLHSFKKLREKKTWQSNSDKAIEHTDHVATAVAHPNGQYTLGKIFLQY